MTENRSFGIDYNDVPADFPGEHGTSNLERWTDWGICEELAKFLGQECLEVKLLAHRAERPVDILLKSYMRVAELGWGEPAELRWVFRRVAVLLNWPAPDVVRRP